MTSIERTNSFICTTFLNAFGLLRPKLLCSCNSFLLLICHIVPKAELSSTPWKFVVMEANFTIVVASEIIVLVSSCRSLFEVGAGRAHLESSDGSSTVFVFCSQPNYTFSLP